MKAEDFHVEGESKEKDAEVGWRAVDMGGEELDVSVFGVSIIEKDDILFLNMYNLL